MPSLQYLMLRGDKKGSFFLDPDGKAVRKPWFVEQLRSILSSIGAPQHQYAGHSFRIGAATIAAMAGVEDSTIQALGKWHSAAFLQYIRTSKERLARISVTLAKISKPQTQLTLLGLWWSSYSMHAHVSFHTHGYHQFTLVRAKLNYSIQAGSAEQCQWVLI